jgi:nucleoside-diphosphate-sugar epimerase
MRVFVTGASGHIGSALLGWQPTEPGILADLQDDRLYRQ